MTTNPTPNLGAKPLPNAGTSQKQGDAAREQLWNDVERKGAKIFDTINEGRQELQQFKEEAGMIHNDGMRQIENINKNQRAPRDTGITHFFGDILPAC